MSQSDLKTEIRVADMMVTMHAALRDLNARLSAVIDLFVFLFSIALLASVFADVTILKAIGISEEISELTLRISSILVFFFLIVILRVDWKQKAWRHQDAVSKLSRLKFHLKARSLDSSAELDHLREEYRIVMESLPHIPERVFNRLKAKHLRKVAVSKLLSRCPGSSSFLIHIILFFRSNFRQFKSDSYERDIKL